MSKGLSLPLTVITSDLYVAGTLANKEHVRLLVPDRIAAVERIGAVPTDEGLEEEERRRFTAQGDRPHPRARPRRIGGHRGMAPGPARLDLRRCRSISEKEHPLRQDGKERPMTLTSENITSILGPVDETLMSAILSTGATAAELAEAWAWINSEEALVGAGKGFPSGTVAELVAILSADEEDEE